MKQSKTSAEAARKQAAIEGSIAERRMCAIMLRWSLICMVIAPLIIGFGLRGLVTYIDCELYPLNPSLGMGLFIDALSSLVVLMQTLFQFAGYGILGYSILRYGVRPSLPPVFLTLLSAAIINLSGIAETVYLQGRAYIASAISYYLPLWLINFFLAIFSELCVVFLCATIRAAFAKRGRLRVGIAREDKEVRRRNVLRKLYLYIMLLLLAFRLTSNAMDAFASIRNYGAPESFADIYYLCSPMLSATLYAVLGYFAAKAVGARLTKKNLAILEEVKK